MYQVYILTPYGTTRTDLITNNKDAALLRVWELEYEGNVATYDRLY